MSSSRLQMLNSFNTSKNAQGIALLVTGLTLFAVQDVIVKLLSAHFPVHQIMFIRGLIALPLLLVLIAYDGGFTKLKTPHPWQNLIRSLAILVSYMSFYLAIVAIPIPTALSLLYTAPLCITLLAVPLLGEKIGWRRLTGIGIGFAGVLVMLRPGFTDFSMPMVLALISAVSYALSAVLARRMGVKDSAAVMAFYTTFLMTYAGAMIGIGVHLTGIDPGDDPVFDFLLKPWAMPDGASMVGLLSIGFISALGFYLLTQAYRIGTANAVAPFEYSNMIWAVMLSYLVFANVPDVFTFLGMALIIGGGIYVLRREGIVRDKPLAAKGPYRAR